MRTISLHVNEDDYRRFQAVAEHEGRSVASLIREAMREHLEREATRRDRPSLRDLAPHPSGALLEPWQRSDVYDEMTSYGFEVHEPSPDGTVIGEAETSRNQDP
ncbi:MAG: DUF6290 family protein [Acidobacteriota bacterium]|nr:DUF6290 family protein [Acidobacteriota bacterium]